MIEILEGPHGPGLRCRGEILHHPDHPRKEARALTGKLKATDRGCILVFGVGLGYHLHALAENSPRPNWPPLIPTQSFWPSIKATTGMTNG